MGSGAIDRNSAMMRGRAAQGAVALVLLGGVVMGAMGVPGVRRDQKIPELKLPAVEAPAAPRGPEAPARAVDAMAMSARLSLVSNHPKQPEVSHDPKGAEPPPPPPPAPETKYLGALGVGKTMMGLLSQSGSQKFVRVGQKLADDSSVVEITEQHLVAEGAGGRKVYEVGQRVGDGLTRPGPAAVAAANMSAVAAANAAMANAKSAGIKTLAPSPRPPTPASAAVRNKPKRKPGMPDGSPERFEEIVSQLKSSGSGSGDEEMMQKAKSMFEEETVRAQEKGGPK